MCIYFNLTCDVIRSCVNTQYVTTYRITYSIVLMCEKCIIENLNNTMSLTFKNG